MSGKTDAKFSFAYTPLGSQPPFLNLSEVGGKLRVAARRGPKPITLTDGTEATDCGDTVMFDLPIEALHELKTAMSPTHSEDVERVDELANNATVLLTEWLILNDKLTEDDDPDGDLEAFGDHSDAVIRAAINNGIEAALSTMNGEALENKLVEAYEHGWDEGAESAVEEGQMPHHDTKNEGSGLYRQAIQREALDRPLAFTLATLRAKESE